MKNKPRKAAPVQAKPGLSTVSTLATELVALSDGGKWRQLVARARLGALRHPTQPFFWQALGLGLLRQSHFAPALEAYLRWARYAPDDADAYNNIGNTLRSLGRLEEAVTSFRRSLELNSNQSEARTNLGLVLSDLGKHAEAIQCHRKALEFDAGAAGTYNNLGAALLESGSLSEAVDPFHHAVGLDPTHFEAWVNLGLTFRNLKRLNEAEAAFRRALEINPGSVIVLRSLGVLLGNFLGRKDEGLALLEQAYSLAPADPDVCIDLGNQLQLMGRPDNARDMYHRAFALRPLITRSAKKRPARFSVVALDTPGAGSTPTEYLLGNADYDLNIHCVMPDFLPDLALLRARGDVVVNLIADADNGKEILPLAAELADRIGCPVINHPRNVMRSDRATLAGRLTGIPGFSHPLTKCFLGVALAEAARQGGLPEFSMPILARIAGTHGGDDLEKYSNWADVREFVERNPSADYYLTDYVDYRSPDGYFRKYRLIYVGGELFPYHLAIHDNWKVHHFRTDMANQVWMREEEESFLKSPDIVFDGAQYVRLRELCAGTGLDYCGVDCAVTATGEVVVFEANAAMLVHDETDAAYLYKNPFISRIKHAYDGMLEKVASCSDSAKLEILPS